VGDLRRDLVEDKRRDEANDTLWNSQGHGYEVWIVKRLSIGDPVETSIQLIQELFVSKRIECPRMYPELDCPLRLEHSAILSENTQSTFSGGILDQDRHG
jgi:hypothetical protein